MQVFLTLVGIAVASLGFVQSGVVLFSQNSRVQCWFSAVYLGAIIGFFYIFLACNAMFLNYGELPEFYNPFGCDNDTLKRLTLTLAMGVISFILFSCGFVFCAVEEFIHL